MAAALVKHQPVASTSKTTSANAQTTTKVPAFLNKLYSMCEDASLDRLIHWNEAEDGFIVPYPEQFARELLPRFFKHSNFGSFVRQLNMYGFGKVLHMQQGVLKAEPSDHAESLEFKNENFKRGQQDLLQFIHRKKAGHGAGDEKTVATTNTSGSLSPGLAVDLHTLLSDVATVRQHQTAISTDLKDLAESNKQLWNEAFESRKRHQKHQETINKIVRFLGTVFGGKILSPGNSPAPSPGLNTQEMPPSHPPPRRQRLLLKDNPDNQTSPRVREIEVPLDELEDLPTISSQQPNNDWDGSRFATLDTPSNGNSPSSSTNNDMQIGQVFSPSTQANLFNFADNTQTQPFTGPSEPQQQQISRVIKDHAAINSQMDTLQANLDRLVAGLNIPQPTSGQASPSEFDQANLEGSGDFDLDAFLKTFGTADQQNGAPSTQQITSSAPDLSSTFPDYFMTHAPDTSSNDPSSGGMDQSTLRFEDLIDEDGLVTVHPDAAAKVTEVEDESQFKGNKKKRSSSVVSESGLMGPRRTSARKRTKPA